MILGVNELKTIFKDIPKSGIVLLKGDLGAGKTTFVKEYVSSIGLNDEVSSPTFSILNIYSNRVFHYDIYNQNSSKFIESGLFENLEAHGIHFIEWADETLENILERYGFKYINLEIRRVNNNKREYCLCTN
jgi:tRNA threonylcarbamoyladenosine biosynthesis protein TsaE